MQTTQIQLREPAPLNTGVHIEKAIRAIPGVRAVKFQSDANRITIEHDAVEDRKLLAAVTATGIDAQIIPADAEVLAPPLPNMKEAE